MISDHSFMQRYENELAGPKGLYAAKNDLWIF